MEFSFERVQNINIYTETKPQPLVLNVDTKDDDSIKHLQQSIEDIMVKNDAEQFSTIKARLDEHQTEIEKLSKLIDQLKTQTYIQPQPLQQYYLLSYLKHGLK